MWWWVTGQWMRCVACRQPLAGTTGWRWTVTAWYGAGAATSTASAALLAPFSPRQAAVELQPPLLPRPRPSSVKHFPTRQLQRSMRQHSARKLQNHRLHLLRLAHGWVASTSSSMRRQKNHQERPKRRPRRRCAFLPPLCTWQLGRSTVQRCCRMGPSTPGAGMSTDSVA